MCRWGGSLLVGSMRRGKGLIGLNCIGWGFGVNDGV